MYIPPFNEEKVLSVLHSLIKSHPFGTWATLAHGEIVVDHIPFVLHETRGEFGTLVGHVAKANPIWHSFATDVESAIVFRGDQAYVTPSWYPTKHKHGKAVPTWNYVAVHAYGTPKVIEDPAWMLAHLNEITDIHESQQSLPWKVSDAPDEFIEKLMNMIVGIEIPISKLSGKWKLGQNRPRVDQLGLVAGLMSCEDDQSHGLARLLNKHIQANED